MPSVLLALTIVVVPAVLALGGVVLGSWMTRRSAREQGQWSRRAEALAHLRWATDLAVSGQEASVRAGMAGMKALMRSPLLAGEDYYLAETLLEAVADRLLWKES